ncbi:MAG: YqhA family protein [Anaerolineaceae bacterium]
MKILIEKSKYLILIAVATLLITFCFALFWGVAKAVAAWVEVVSSVGKSSQIYLLLIKVIDAFLITLVLYLLAVSIYELFIEDTNLPDQLVARNFLGLKTNLSGVIVLVIAVRFVEFFFAEEIHPDQIVWLALSTALVAGTLIAFGYFGAKSEGHKEK